MNVNRIAALISSIAVIIVVIAGFLLTGPPSEQRLHRLDQRRVDDLATLSRAIDAYWGGREELPADLTELVDGRRLSQLPTDPVSGLDYVYAALPPQHYRLCAGFARATPETEPTGFWQHPSGDHCFDFEVTGTTPPRR